MIQRMKWGTMEMLDLDNPYLSRMGLEIMQVVLNVDCCHVPHRHYDEQIIYVLKGTAKCTIDGNTFVLKKGDLKHWPMGVVHEEYNIGREPFVVWLISNQAGIASELMLREDIGQRTGKPSDKEVKLEELDVGQYMTLYRAVQTVQTQFLDKSNYPFSIYDKNGTLITQSEVFPQYCREICGVVPGNRNCACMRHEYPERFQDEETVVCPRGIEIINIPLVVSHRFMGYIHCGYYWQSGGRETDRPFLHDTTDLTVRSIRKLFTKIANNIKVHCEIRQYQQELQAKDEEIDSEKVSLERLVQNLKAAQYNMTNLRINQHFLMNTLNSMGSMALEKGAPELYSSLVSLSKMFQYTLYNQDEMVTLRQELDYMESYLKLQKLRYKDGLTIEYEIDPEVTDIMVPFNFLQPIVENAFKHAFQDITDKYIKVSCRIIEDILEIQVHNSGHRITEEELREINRNIRDNIMHGLSLIHYKLQLVYGENCQLTISCLPNDYTCVRVEVPVNGKGGASQL